jgi:putative aminopeptidase FrvX
MKRLLLILAFFSGIAFSHAQSDSAVLHRMKATLLYLCSDSLAGRYPGTPGEKMAADYIYTRLKSIKKAKVLRQKFCYQRDSITVASENIIAFFDHQRDTTFIISAHYDHIGMGGSLSFSPGIHAVHPGADDNASGVALLLELASCEKKIGKHYNLVFLASSGHEEGLYGAGYYATHLDTNKIPVRLFINLDMTGRMDQEHHLYYECSPALEASFLRITDSCRDIKAVKSVYNRLGILDSKAFTDVNIPGITLSTGVHLDYHKISDREEYINYEGLLKIKRLILEYLKVKS